jgi:hypothetical protein
LPWQKSQGWAAQASAAGGAWAAAQKDAATAAPSAPTQRTARLRVPPPQAALHSPHADATQTKVAQGAVLQGAVVASAAASQAAPSADWQAACRVAVPPPQAALQAPQAE